MESFVFIILILFTVVFAMIFNKNKKRKHSNYDYSKRPPSYKSPLGVSRKYFPYGLSESLLTQREIAFYKALRPVLKKYNLGVAIKPRVADFIYVLPEHQGKSFWTFFNRISQKHVDFLVCDRFSFAPLLAIELDDKTHITPAGKYRDAYVDEVYAAAGLKILHIYTYNANELDELISKSLELNIESEVQ